MATLRGGGCGRDACAATAGEDRRAASKLGPPAIAVYPPANAKWGGCPNCESGIPGMRQTVTAIAQKNAAMASRAADLVIVKTCCIGQASAPAAPELPRLSPAAERPGG